MGKLHNYPSYCTRISETMWHKGDWRHRPSSKRRKLVQALSDGQDSFRFQSTGRARQIYHFFADFWRSTPHPFAQVHISTALLLLLLLLLLSSHEHPGLVSIQYLLLSQHQSLY